VLGCCGLGCSVLGLLLLLLLVVVVVVLLTAIEFLPGGSIQYTSTKIQTLDK
jgi:hypothetical protein